MKIQEMRSGFSALSKRKEEKRLGNFYLTQPPTPDHGDWPDTHRTVEAISDLDRPMWSVVSFDAVERSSLTYAQASDLIERLDARDLSGLCIVTDAASENLRT